jgi:hypothetical protein
VASLVLARLQNAEAAQGMAMRQPGDVGFSGVVCEEGFQTEVEARHMTGRDSFRFWHLLSYTEKQPEPSGGIPFDGQGFHLPTQGTMLDEFVSDTLNFDFAPRQTRFAIGFESILVVY